MPFIALNRTRPGSIAGKAVAADQARQNAIAESTPTSNEGGMVDPYNTESVVGGRGGLLEGFQPGSPSGLSDYLGNLGHVTRYAQAGRGGMGAPGGDDMLGALLHKIRGVARGINPKQSEDLAQGGVEAVVKAMQEKGLSGPEAVAYARNAMKNQLSAGGQGVAKGPEATAVRNVLNSKQDTGEFGLWSEVRKQVPGMSLERFRQLRSQLGTGNPARNPASLDAPVGEGQSTSLSDLIKNEENPEIRAAISERLDKLTDAQKANLDKHLGGETVHPQILDRIMKKLNIREGGPAKPISGGSAGQSGFEDLNGFPPREVMNGQINEEQLPLSISDFWKDVGPAGNGHTQIPAVGQGRLAGTTQFLDQGGLLPEYPSVVGAHPSMRSMDRFVPGAAKNIYGNQDELDQLRSWLMDAATSASRN